MTLFGCAIWRNLRATGTVIFATLVATVATAQTPELDRLISAYPLHLSHVDGNVLIWKDGTRMTVDDGTFRRERAGAYDHEAMLATADISAMLATPYPAGKNGRAPARNIDPGRARNAAFFDKMYGSCLTGDVTRSLVDVLWLPRKGGGRVKVTTINSVHDKVAAISRELDTLPATFDRYLVPAAGAYVCRPIAGTTRVSAHGHGIAIDIAVKTTDYWRWNNDKGPGDIPYRNRVPIEIVEIFERHGFIWGGKWYHYDTMHFEYRPELVGQ